MDRIIINTYISEIREDLSKLPKNYVDKFFQIYPKFPDELPRRQHQCVDWENALYLVRSSVANYRNKQNQPTEAQGEG